MLLEEAFHVSHFLNYIWTFSLCAGGAPLNEIQRISTQNINMDWTTFMSLDKDVIMVNDYNEIWVALTKYFPWTSSIDMCIVLRLHVQWFILLINCVLYLTIYAKSLNVLVFNLLNKMQCNS